MIAPCELSHPNWSRSAGGDVAAARGSDTKTLEISDEMDVSAEEARIGVFVCNCGINIGAVVDVPAVREYAAGLPNVVFSDENLFTCSQDNQEKIKEKIKEEKLNRVVVVSCSPKTHAFMFMETLEACSLNKYLFEMANIRNQDSWVHANNPDIATEKAKDLVRAAVARVATLKPLHGKKIPVNKKALVIGGGIAGMNALHLLRAMQKGADGAYVVGCLEGTCHYNEGNFRARERVEYVRTLLEEIGMEGDRVRMYNLFSGEDPTFAAYAKEMTEHIRSLGPNPLKGSGNLKKI